jgi:hypothetical protein
MRIDQTRQDVTTVADGSRPGYRLGMNYSVRYPQLAGFAGGQHDAS